MRGDDSLGKKGAYSLQTIVKDTLSEIRVISLSLTRKTGRLTIVKGNV